MEGNRRTEDLLWETDHCAKFQANLVWPPTFDEGFARKTSHLGRRMQEIIWYIENTVSADLLPATTADINYSINWVNTHQNKISCIVGTSHFWLFGRSFENNTIDMDAGLELAGHEALALQGYSISSQSEAFVSTLKPQDQTLLASRGVVYIHTTSDIVLKYRTVKELYNSSYRCVFVIYIYICEPETTHSGTVVFAILMARCHDLVRPKHCGGRMELPN